MKFTEFNEQIQRLIKVYGQTRFPEERTIAIYEQVVSVDIDSFKKQVTYFIASSEKAPMADDFINGLGSILQESKKRAIDEKLKHLPACINCNGTGHVTMYEKKSGWEFAFQCQCLRGALLMPSASKQYPGMENTYASHRAWATGKFDRLGAIRSNRNLVETELRTPRETGSLLKPLSNTLTIVREE